MSYDTFDYSISGYPSSFSPRRISKILKQETEAGYTATSAAFTRDYWTFQVGWNAMSPNGYIYLMNFYHSHRGGSLFYFRWPTGQFGAEGSTSGLSSDYVAGAPGAYEADPGSSYPFGSETAPGFGYSSIYLVRFDIDDMEASLINARKNLWQVSITLRST